MIYPPYSEWLRGAVMLQAGLVLSLQFFIVLFHRRWRMQQPTQGPLAKNLDLAAVGVSLLAIGTLVGTWVMRGRPLAFSVGITMIGWLILSIACLRIMLDTQSRL